MADKKVPQKSLHREIKSLSKVVDKQNNYWRRFLLGLVFGTGTAIGATFIGGLILYIFSLLFGSTDLVSFLK